MKLSELIAYRQLLDDYQPRDSREKLEQTVGPIRHVVESHNIQFPELKGQLDKVYDDLQLDLNRFDSTLGLIRQQLQEAISSIEPKYLSASYQLYEEMANDSVETILNRRPTLDEATHDYVQGRIKTKTDWKRPGLILRPGLEDWIDDVVALDPLYLVDVDHALLEPAVNRFNPQFQRRLRKYIIKESSDEEMMSSIPNGQFGLVVAYNFFNYKPFEMVKKYLTEIYNKLVPGGVLTMTYNDCDRFGGVDLCERFFMCYTPGTMIKALAENIGFTINLTYNIDAACTWMELSKPGTKVSLRGGQALAKIVYRPVRPDKVAKKVVPDPEPVYNEAPLVRVYTSKQLTELQKEAIEMGIDTPEKIVNAYSPETLEKLVKRRKKNARSST